MRSLPSMGPVSRQFAALLISSYLLTLTTVCSQEASQPVGGDSSGQCDVTKADTCSSCSSLLQIPTESCCTGDVIYAICEVCTANPMGCLSQAPWLDGEAGMEDEDDVEKRAKYFLGKRSRASYFLGKRPRNNFLGKRSDEFSQDADFYADEPGMLEDAEAKRRIKPFLGKRPQPFLGKRAKYFLGKREDDSEFDADEDKRAKYFLGKRRQHFLGKRAKYFLGKRDSLEDALVDDQIDLKRAKYFLGKRRQHFLGKREAEEQSDSAAAPASTA